MFKVLVCDPLSEEGLQPLRDHPSSQVDILTNLSREELLDKVADYDALLVRSQTTIDAAVIHAALRLKIIGRAGVGVDNIDLQAATEQGVLVVNAPDGNTNSAAEHTLAMLMSLARNIPQAFHALKNRQWDRKSFIGVELKGKTLGVIGLGRIGAEVAQRAKGQRMKVVAYDPFLTVEKAEKLGVTMGTVDEVIQVADFITVHTPLVKETKHLLNQEAFEKMKPGVQLVNCARGGIIDEDALYDAIQSGKVAGAALDVFEIEPFVDHKLLSLPQVIATPHLGASTVEAQEVVAVDVCDDVVRYFTGQAVKNPVNLSAVPKDVLKKVEPYLLLGEKLGSFVQDLANGLVEEFRVVYSGELQDIDVSPITRNVLKGFLRSRLGESVNEVNAKLFADRLGITVVEQKTSQSKGFTSLITVEVLTKVEVRKVSGTLLNGLGARIVRVDDFIVDVPLEAHLVFIRHKDQPGAIGRVGMSLAEERINIATMQVGRAERGGAAIMMLTVDKHVKAGSVTKLKTLPDIEDVIAIEL
ncbi:phosphoglycerate dehydrogenase [Chryseomicrobium sp. FSL W7-1435]|uniref:phosphoglycerate dehydrogenase n=1 Tax=Chryseomicrobium sp. FSL W7-1435 TaxID=2921704 RepID=UPI00315B2954